LRTSLQALVVNLFRKVMDKARAAGR